MRYDPTDPGPVLDSYDPQAEARFDAATRLREIVVARRTPRQDHALLASLAQERHAAFRSRARYGWERDADLRAAYEADGVTDAPGDLRIPSPPYDATCDELEAHYARWTQARARSRFVASLPPARDWETGIFAQTLPTGVTRAVRQAVVEIPNRDAPLRMSLVVERHWGTTHVCAIQGPSGGAGITEHVQIVADWVAGQYLPRPGLLDRLGRSSHRLVVYHTWTPDPLGPPQQLVWAYAVRWHRTGVQTCRLGTREMTPYLRDRSLALILASASCGPTSAADGPEPALCTSDRS